MKNMKKILALGLCTVLTTACLGGCGSSSSTADGTKEAEAGTTANSTSTETAAAAAGDTVTIEFFNQKTEIVSILESLIAEYEAANPGVKIEMTTPSDAATVLASRMASNDTPDVFTNWPNSSFFTMVDSGYVMDLSGTGIMDNVQDAAREQWKYNGGEYAATISYNCSGIWYNETIFEEAGITELPKTFDELVSVCETLQASGITPFVTSAKQTDITDRQLQVFLASSMGESYDAFAADASAGTLDATKEYAADLEKMAEKMVKILEYSQSDTLGTDQDSATANFANGQGAMMIGGSWLLASVKAANPDIAIAMMPIPGDTAAETNTCAYPGDMSLCIAADSDVSEEAIAFVTWMTSVETATKYAEAEGNPSCIKGVDYVAEEFSGLYEDYVTTGQFILNPDCNWTSAQQDASGAAVQQLYYDMDPAAFAENLQEAFNEN